MTENEHIALIVGVVSIINTAVNVGAVVVSRLMSRSEHRETQTTVEDTHNAVQAVHDIVAKNGQGKHEQ